MFHKKHSENDLEQSDAKSDEIVPEIQKDEEDEQDEPQPENFDLDDVDEHCGLAAHNYEQL